MQYKTSLVFICQFSHVYCTTWNPRSWSLFNPTLHNVFIIETQKFNRIFERVKAIFSHFEFDIFTDQQNEQCESKYNNVLFQWSLVVKTWLFNDVIKVNIMWKISIKLRETESKMFLHLILFLVSLCSDQVSLKSSNEIQVK